MKISNILKLILLKNIGKKNLLKIIGIEVRSLLSNHDVRQFVAGRGSNFIE